MSRGFLSGAAWGTVIAGFGLVVASQVADVQPSQLQDAPAQVPAQVAADQPAPKRPALGGPESAVAESAQATSEQIGPRNETPAADVPTGGEAKVEGEAEAVAEGALAPEMPQDGVPELAAAQDASASGEMPVVPSAVGQGSTSAAAPMGIGAEAPAQVPAIDSRTAVLPEAQVDAPVPEAPPAVASAPTISGNSDSPHATVNGATAPLPEGGTADTPPAGVETPPPVPTEMAESTVVAALPEGGDAMGTSSEGPEEPVQAEDADVDVVIVVPAEPEPEPESGPESGPEIGAESAPEPDLKSVATRPAPGFGGKVEGVKTGRLPSIGGASTEAAQAETIAGSEPEVLEPDPATLPAIDRFARSFENPDRKPLFAILLQDTGGPEVDREALAKLPFPVSFVIDPTQPDAAVAAKIYRDGGQEVLMLASGIPAGATASDLSVSFEAMALALPDAVGVVDKASGGFQGNRTLATQVLALVVDQGRGVISWDRGLNAASQVARREGIRNAMIFRALDDEDESAPRIRRYLDRAAFKAAQDGRVVVAGRTRPETVTALLEWAVEGRAATVALAPSTAVMIAQ